MTCCSFHTQLQNKDHVPMYDIVLKLLQAVCGLTSNRFFIINTVTGREEGAGLENEEKKKKCWNHDDMTCSGMGSKALARYSLSHTLIKPSSIQPFLDFANDTLSLREFYKRIASLPGNTNQCLGRVPL